MLIQVIICFCTLIFSVTTSANEIAKGSEDWRKLNQIVKERFDKQRYVKLNRQTRQGLISSCEADFQGALFDTRYEVGSALLVTGSLSLFYAENKAPIYGLKLRVERISDTPNGPKPLEAMDIPYAGFIIDKEAFSAYRLAQQPSDNGYVVVGYGDSDLSITGRLLAKAGLEAVQITFSPQLGGVDLSFTLENFSSAAAIAETDSEFRNCLMEVLSEIQNDMGANQ